MAGINDYLRSENWYTTCTKGVNKVAILFEQDKTETWIDATMGKDEEERLKRVEKFRQKNKRLTETASNWYSDTDNIVSRPTFPNPAPVNTEPSIAFNPVYDESPPVPLNSSSYYSPSKRD